MDFIRSKFGTNVQSVEYFFFSFFGRFATRTHSKLAKKMFICTEVTSYKIHTLAQGSYEWIIMLKKCGRLDLTVFQLIWVIGTYDNWKYQNPGGRFGATY